MSRFFADARLVAGKDLRIEARSRVVLNQVAPFALLVLVLFGFALDADQRTLRVELTGLEGREPVELDLTVSGHDRGEADAEHDLPGWPAAAGG